MRELKRDKAYFFLTIQDEVNVNIRVVEGVNLIYSVSSRLAHNSLGNLNHLTITFKEICMSFMSKFGKSWLIKFKFETFHKAIRNISKLLAKR